MSQSLSAKDRESARSYLREGDPAWALCVPLGEIFAAVETVTGIALMAGVNRKTVQRQRIKEGSLGAVKFIDKIRAERAAERFNDTPPNGYHPKFLPLLYQPGCRPPVLFRGCDVLATIRNVAGNRDSPIERRVVVDQTGATASHFVLQIGKTKRFRAKGGRVLSTLGARDATPEELKNRIFTDKKGGTLPVKMLCVVLGISRAGFYKWLGNLSAYQRARVKHALRFPQSATPASQSPRPLPAPAE